MVSVEIGGHAVQADDEDIPLLWGDGWRVEPLAGPRGRPGWRVVRGQGKRLEHLDRLLLGEQHQVRHLDGDGLNCQRANLLPMAAFIEQRRQDVLAAVAAAYKTYPPSYQEISDATGMPLCIVKRYVWKLCEEGVLVKEGRKHRALRLAEGNRT